MIFKNLTNNPVTVFTQDGGQKVFETEPVAAKCKISQNIIEEIDGIEIVSLVYSKLNNELPKEQDGVGYIVSKVAAESILMDQQRGDLYVPCLQVRDRGKILGCRCLERAG